MSSDVAVRPPLVWRLGLLATLLSFACVSPAPDDTAAVSGDANVAAARRLIEEPWNNRNMAVLADAYTADYVSYTNGVRDTVPAQSFIEGTLQQYPDARVTIVETIATGDRVVMHWTWTATAVPASSQATIHGATISRWVDGKVAEDHTFYDLLGFTLATGATVTPPAGTTPPTTTTTGQ